MIQKNLLSFVSFRFLNICTNNELMLSIINQNRNPIKESRLFFKQISLLSILVITETDVCKKVEKWSGGVVFKTSSRTYTHTRTRKSL